MSTLSDPPPPRSHWQFDFTLALDRWLVAKIGRYAIAGFGPVAMAGAHFMLSLVMLRTMAPSEFGTFSFLFVAAQLGLAAASALFATPLQVLLADRTLEQREAGRNALFAVAIVTATGACILYGAIAMALSLTTPAVLSYALFGGAGLLRSFGRAWCYAERQQLRVTASDFAYSGVILIALAMIWLVLHDRASILGYVALATATIVGLLPLGRTFLARQFGRPRLSALRGYGSIWRDQSRWALVGVVTTEATANAHVYAVTLWLGAAAFAPLAAAALLLRPVNVAQNALTEFERPLMARLIGEGKLAEMRRSILVFRLALMAIWLAAGTLGIVLFTLDPYLLYPSTYDADTLWVAFVLWMVVAAATLLQAPEATMLQATGSFRPLAWANVWASIASVVGVVVILPLAGATWTIAGVALGWAVSLVLIQRSARHWIAARHPAG